MSIENLKTNTLFLGLVRPAMTMGVTYEYFFINAIFSLCLFLLAGNIAYALVWIPIHIFGVFAHRFEHHFVRLFQCKAKFPKVKNQSFWGVTSYEPY
ncbi:TPA: type IV secretion system protein VirB3 [Legionella pneumophila]